jgi:uncharacterized surface protein with fasciclin (FAS1) repeats
MKRLDIKKRTIGRCNTKVAAPSKYSIMKKAVLTAALGLFLFACNDPYDGTTFTAYEEKPISTFLDEHPQDFSTWVELLRYTNLYNTLNVKTDYTAFVPNNAAMADYLQAKGVATVTELNLEEAVYLVRNHIIHGKAIKKSQFSPGAIEWKNANDDNLTVVFGTTNSGVYINGYGLIVEADIAATNGVIHALNKVLVPITATVFDRLSDSRYSILKEAVVMTGYDELLKTVSVDDIDQNGKPFKRRYFYTLFAIADSTFNVDNINNVTDLISLLGVNDVDYTNSSNGLNQYVAYHILSQLKSSTNFMESLVSDTSKNINTLASRELINLSVSKTKDLQLNFDYGLNSGTRVLKADIPCKNGVVHEVSTWMPVKTPPLTVVVWDLTDYAELGAVCKYFQSPTPNGGSSTYTKTLAVGEVSSYTWESIPANKTTVVTYVNNRINDGVYYQTQNYDHLRLELGAGGWVEMQSPDIVKGKYKITIGYISYLSTTNAGEMQCYIDGVKVGASFFVSNNSQDALKTVVLNTGYSFTSTDSHKLRIVGIDGKRLSLDYIKFEPIK